MLKNFETEQEEFWVEDFGNSYINRNDNPNDIANNTHFFSKVLSKCRNITSIIEFGSNIGQNLHALHHLLPGSEISAIEINNNAVKELVKIKFLKEYFHKSILEYEPNDKYDFVFTKGVLIHINPDKLKDVYRLLYDSSNKYVLIAEYYNPTPVEINYRGNKGKLFKRDFAGEIMDMYTDLELLDYGFVYHRDSTYPKDDVSWFLLSKNH